MSDPVERLKVLVNSSTPVVVIETVEEARAIRLIRLAADELQLPVFEWSIADGLTRAGGIPVNSAPLVSRVEPPPRPDGTVYGQEEERLHDSIMSGLTREQTGIYNTKEPAHALAHLESMSIEAVYILSRTFTATWKTQS
jgi:hypothetical protein